MAGSIARGRELSFAPRKGWMLFYLGAYCKLLKKDFAPSWYLQLALRLRAYHKFASR